MASNNTNESYNRCLAELRERYRYRGVSSNVKSEMLLQDKQEEASRAAYPTSYVLFDAKLNV